MLHSMMLGIQCYLCVLGSLLVPPKPDIIKVCDANRWYTYAWYDTDNVLILHAKNSEGGLPPRQSGVEYIDKLNLQTGKTEALPELNAFWNQHHSSFTDRSYITIDVRNERL